MNQKAVSIEQMLSLEVKTKEYLVTSLGAIKLKIQSHKLIVPKFRIKKKQIFINHNILSIDLQKIKPGRYRVVAIQNFQIEDRNPNLDECLSGVFLGARLSEDKWEEPENFPVECRQLEILGYLSVGPVHPIKSSQ
jgi:hypothetical protein